MGINKIQIELIILLIISAAFALIIPVVFNTSSYFLFLLIYFFSHLFLKDCRRLILYGFALNVVVVIVIYKYYQSIYGVDYPYYLGGSDDLMYQSTAQDFVSKFSIWSYNSILGNIVPTWHNSPGYIFLVSLVVRFGDLLGGYHTIMPRLVNLFFLNLLAFTTFKICENRLMLSKKHCFQAAALILLLPLPVYISSHIYRDTFVSLLYLSSFYLLLSNKIKLWHISYIVTCILLISQFRYITSILLVITFILIRVYYIKHRFVRLLSYFITALIILFFLLKLDVVVKLEDYSEGYSEYRSGLSTGLATKIFNIPLPIGIIPRMLYYVVTPVPQISNNIVFTYLSLGTLVQMLAFPYLLLAIIDNVNQYIKKSRNINKNIFLISVFFLILWIGLSATTFSERHMIMFYPFAIIVTVYGLSKSKLLKRNKKLILFCSIYPSVILLIGYALIK